MPRITAPTIAEHVATQEAAVVAAARRLFVERGVAAVSIGDIATEVGLRRTSLYRYFPTKAHILQRWFDLEMDPLIERSLAVTGEYDDPAVALADWLDVQLDFITDEAHTSLVDATASATHLPPEVLAPAPARRRVRAQLIAGLRRSSADLLARGVRHADVRRELHRAATAVAGL